MAGVKLTYFMGLARMYMPQGKVSTIGIAPPARTESFDTKIFKFRICTYYRNIHCETDSSIATVYYPFLLTVARHSLTIISLTRFFSLSALSLCSRIAYIWKPNSIS